MVDHGATLQDVAIAADLGSELNVLLGNQDGNTLGQQVLYHDGQLVHDDGGQTFGDLVQQHHLGVLHQAAGNRQHLLLTAGKLITLGVLAFLQAGEEFVHRFQVPLIAAVHALTCCHTQVFLGGQGGENVAALGHVGNAQAGDCVALHADQFFMSIKIIVFRQHTGSDKFLLKCGNIIQQIFRRTAANVVNCVRRNR